MTTHPEIEALVADLARLAAPPAVVNMYALDGPPGNAARRANLVLALSHARARGPDLLIVGEAPGYNGARLTGVPITSEQLLAALAERMGDSNAAGYTVLGEGGRRRGESTATIVARELDALGLFAAGWNAFPLHPHRPGDDQSNRAPRVSELVLGRPFLARVLALFPEVPVVAMGRVAALALTALEVQHTHVRHPSQGGATAFAAGLRAFGATLRQRAAGTERTNRL
jgi:uracil-DNA glycosylase